MNFEKDIALLKAADLFYPADPEDGPQEDQYVLNMNDVWGWACSWGEEVPKDKIPELAGLYRLYGWPGVLYWVSCRHGNMHSEFRDNNRFIDFVANEENLRKEVPDANNRAYKRVRYTLGE